MTGTRPRVERVKLDTLTPHPRNVREGDVGAIAASLRAFGQYRPIVAQRSDGPGIILAGTHTWMAHQALVSDAITQGEDPTPWETIDVSWVDVPDDVALRIMLTDNRTHDLGRDRTDDLAQLLAELPADDWAGIGWDRDDLDNLLRDLGTYDPGAGVLRAFEGVTGAGANEGTWSDQTRLDPDSIERVAFTVSLTKEERGVVLAAMKRAKAAGYATQPEAIVAIARAYSKEG